MDAEPEVLYEDDHVIGIAKPAGLVVHAGIGTGHTLADWISARYPMLDSVGEPYIDPSGRVIERPGMVHRLDKETSGVMVLAKRQEVFDTLKKHFQKGRVRKEYHAFVYGKPKRRRGTVSLPIGKSRGDFRKQAIRFIRGEAREARTEYVFVASCADNTSFMKFYPQTGRTHQIRVHAQSLQIPIVGDAQYARSRAVPLGFGRLALHAYRLTLHTHLWDEPLHIIAPYPEDFTRAMAVCGVRPADS